MAKKILMVCLGNICRSPLAEGIMKKLCEEKKLNWQVDSAGTGGWHTGELPDRRSQAVALKNGLDIADQRARQIKKSDFKHFDTIYALDKSVYNDLKRIAPDVTSAAKVHMLSENSARNKGEDIPDPYYNGLFDLVYEMVLECCNEIINTHQASSRSK